MPVQIKTTDGSGTDSRVITLEEFEQGRNLFNEHYATAVQHLPHPVISQPLGGQVNEMPWDVFAQTIADFMAAYPEVPEEDIAMRFVHCYEQGMNMVYQRMQLCAMGPVEHIDGHEQRQLLTEHQLWYELRDGNVMPTDDQDLHNDMYLGDVAYRIAPQGTNEERLIVFPTKFVHNLTIPWYHELRTMYIDNGAPADATLKIAAFSRIPESPVAANVEYPHGLVWYLSVAGEDLLNDEDYISVFSHKGADDSTLCPPKCGVYIVPLSAV